MSLLLSHSQARVLNECFLENRSALLVSECVRVNACMCVCVRVCVWRGGSENMSVQFCCG